MRPLKLRAWDKINKRMIYIESFSQIPSNWKDVWILMQFTGLLDKNGKEIWEGDKVTAHYFYFDGNFDADGYITGEIRITPYGVLIWKSDSEARFIYETSHYDEPCLEVIGNIFEGGE
ncbi:MAG: YopX family protein [Bacteroidales bacterium]